MAIENLPQPQSPLPKISVSSLSAVEDTPRHLRDLHAEVVSLRQTLNAVLTHLHNSSES